MNFAGKILVVVRMKHWTVSNVERLPNSANVMISWVYRLIAGVNGSTSSVRTLSCWTMLTRLRSESPTCSRTVWCVCPIESTCGWKLQLITGKRPTRYWSISVNSIRWHGLLMVQMATVSSVAWLMSWAGVESFLVSLKGNPMLYTAPLTCRQNDETGI